MRATIIKKMEFEAAHFLPESSYTGKCNNTHGHSYKILVSIHGEINPNTGMVIDFSILKKSMKKCISRLDHRLLNEVICNPTAENIILWIWERLVKYKPMHWISQIELWETSNSCCIIRSEDIDRKLLNSWKENYDL